MTARPAVPAILVSWLAVFRPCFTAPVWNHILVLVSGAVLAPGKRTVTQALRVMGLAEQPGFGRYHEALNRARWDARDVARRLLLHLLAVLAPRGEVVIGIDDTIERRWGGENQGAGHLSRPGAIVTWPVRQNQRPALAVAGGDAAGPVRGPTLGLPFLTVLAPSARWSERQGRRHKALTDWARQAILQSKRWLPDRRVVVVADSSFAALELIAAVRRQVCLITRLRLDASLFEPARERRPGQIGQPPLKGKRRPKLSAVLADPKTVWTSVMLTEWYGGQTRKLEYVSNTAVWYHSGLPPAAIRWVLVRDPSGQRDAQAFLCTDLDLEPDAILSLCVPLADRDNLSRGTRTPGRRDAAAVVGPGHPADHPSAARTLFAGDRPGAWADANTQHRCSPPSRRLVQQTPTDLQRRDRSRPTRALVTKGFTHVPVRGGKRANSRRLAKSIRGDSLPRSLNCGKSS